MKNLQPYEEQKKIFAAAKKCDSIEKLKNVIHSFQKDIEKFENKYKPLDFNITIAELAKDKRICKKNNDLIIDKSTFNALEKVLISVLWKNGMLNRLPSFLSGVKDEEYQKKTGLIFNQFGRHMKDYNEPIVDINCLTAFAVYEKGIITHNENERNKFIDEYRVWFKAIVGKVIEKNRKDFSYHLDKLMFLLGKNLKNKKSKSQSKTEY